VVGVETSAEAVGAARAAAERLPESLSATVEFVAADATRGGFAALSPNLVVVNPPRRGLGPELATWLDRSDAAHVVYSSCHLDSLVRDLSRMPSLRVTTGRVFDMFPQTTHLETAVLLERR
jgi:23S rRNA (uracil747-C5)-methyltransferase